MADNTARARGELDSMRRTIRDHQRKWRDHKEPYEKNFALKTIQNVQSNIAKIKSKHPSLSSAPEDTWRP